MCVVIFFEFFVCCNFFFRFDEEFEKKDLVSKWKNKYGNKTMEELNGIIFRNVSVLPQGETWRGDESLLGLPETTLEINDNLPFPLANWSCDAIKLCLER